MSVPFTQAQDDLIRTQTRPSYAAAECLLRIDEVDAGTITGMLNEGLFALECALPKKMRAIIMFISKDDVVRVESDGDSLNVYALGRYALGRYALGRYALGCGGRPYPHTQNLLQSP